MTKLSHCPCLLFEPVAGGTFSSRHDLDSYISIKGLLAGHIHRTACPRGKKLRDLERGQHPAKFCGLWCLERVVTCLVVIRHALQWTRSLPIVGRDLGGDFRGVDTKNRSRDSLNPGSHHAECQPEIKKPPSERLGAALVKRGAVVT